MTHLGIDIGGTNTKAVLLDDAQNVLARTSLPTIPDGTAESIVRRIMKARDELCTLTGLETNAVRSCGLGIPGIVDAADGQVVFAPNLGLLNRVPLSQLVEDAIGLPCGIANDAVCAGIAEANVGAGIACERMLLVTIGTGVGVSYLVDGEPFDGWGSYGGELGHIPLHHGTTPCSCGTSGCFQQCASSTALGYLAWDAARANPDSLLFQRCAGDTEVLNAQDVFEAAAQQDETAERVLEQYFTYLAEGIGGLVNIFRPDIVVLGGGLIETQPQVGVAIEKLLPQHVYASAVIGSPQIAVAQCGHYAGALGAALLAPGRQPERV